MVTTRVGKGIPIEELAFGCGRRIAVLLIFCVSPPLFGQLAVQEKTKLDANDPAALNEDKRVLGVIPNYRTAESMKDYHPISITYKLTIAAKDSFDYPLVGLGAAFAGLYQLENTHPQFGQGTLGYFRRVSTAYADQAIGNMMTEGFLPALLKEDPRYFRMAEGTKKARTYYALSRIFVTKLDNGGHSFNYAEVLGNGVSSAIGLTYYSDNRNLKDFSENWATQLATDAAANVLKEFWPDLKRRWVQRQKARQ
jgi:hypothetical protein